MVISGPALLQGNKAVVSSENGSFFFLDLPIGKYRITASLEGYGGQGLVSTRRNKCLRGIPQGCRHWRYGKAS